MITNYFIPPHPLLQPFVDNYVLCTSHDQKVLINGFWPASNETSLIFYLADTPYHYVGEALSPLQSARGCLVGLQSRSNGVVEFQGVYHTFMIQLKANGYNKIFRMPAKEFVNNLYHSDAVFGNAVRDLNECLYNAKDIQEMAGAADTFLLQFLAHQKKSFSAQDGITCISNELFTTNTLLSIEQYACKANMSVRNFERRFTEQVGVSPKLYCRLLRFNNAVNIKLKHPQASWTNIAYECGYYDQMHMIKDFKEFTNVNPTLFFAQSQFTRTDSDNNATYGGNENFIVVKRTQF